MNETDIKTGVFSDQVDLKQQCAALSRQVTLMLVALFLVSGTLTVFLGIQARRIGKDLDAIRPQARQIMESSAKEEPMINAFMVKLVEYGKTHPDFAPIAAKYRLNTNTVAALKAAAAAAPAKP
jgi:hypothetical protein